MPHPIATVAEAEKAFDALAAGRQVTLPLQPAFQAKPGACSSIAWGRPGSSMASSPRCREFG
jgi:hypothetical protein